MKIRLEKLLSNYGLCTRSFAKNYINKHKITDLNGKPLKADEEVDPTEILIKGKPLDYISPLHIVLHKPVGYNCSFVRELKSEKIVYDLLPERFAKVIPTLSIAGRLDKLVTGLLIMSQDGALVNRITSPTRKHPMGKVYEVEAANPFTGKEPELFEKGEILLTGEEQNTAIGFKCKPAKFEITDSLLNRARITVYEGKYHQIRRMLAAIGNRAKTVHRVQVGPITLDENLAPGQWRLLTKEEIDQIMAPVKNESEIKTSDLD